MKYDYLIVGSGLFGATFAEHAKRDGKKVLVIEKRDHIGGNIYTEKKEYHANIKEIDNSFDINQYEEKSRHLESHFATSIIGSPRACWMIAMVLQVKLWPNMNHLETSDSFLPVSRANSRLLMPFSCNI